MIIDMHAHIVPEGFPIGTARASGDAWPRMQALDSGDADLMIGGKKFRTFRDTAWDPVKRLDDLPNIGMDKQVLSPLPELLMYHLDPRDGADLATHLNEAIAGMVRERPDAYYGLGTVPLQDVELAVAELERIKQLGLLGVEVRSNIEGKNLGDERFRPFFRRAEALDLCIFVHAYASTITDRLPGVPGDAINHLGFPIECGLAGASLIWDGVLAECPKLRICMSHGGGVLTQMLARGDTLHRTRKAVAELLPEPPMEYARLMYYDDLAWNIPTLRYLIDSMGASQIAIGTDYSGASVRTISPREEFDALGLSDGEREQISNANALRFLGVG
ncbi:MAG: amidohydrolase family protein [Dehalococcoidia bacterium]